MSLIRPVKHHAARCRRPALLWLGLVALLLLSLLAKLDSFRVDTDILHLLPDIQQKALIKKAQQQIDGRMQQTVLWLVAAGSEPKAVEKAGVLGRQLRDSGLFASVDVKVDSNDNNLYSTLLPYRYGFLNPQDADLLQMDPQAFLQQRLQLLYSPLGMQYAATLQQDPFFSLGRYINRLYSHNSADIYNDVVVMRDAGRYYALIVSTVGEMDFAGQKALANLHKKLGSADVIAAGLPLYSAYGARNAEQEISLVGTVSIVSIIVFMLLGFRSLRPLALSLVSIASGVVAATAVCSWLFGTVHVITLVFGSSLIGISVDYSFHYFCDRLRRDSLTPADSLKAILPGISLGLGSSVIAYGVLLFTPFLGLKQIGLFSVTGLVMAWLTVVLLYPAVSTKDTRHLVPASALFRFYLQRWPVFCRRQRLWLGLLLLLWLVAGLSQLAFIDDVRAMQQPDAALLAAEKRIAAIGRERPDNQFFIVTASDEKTLLQREQQLLAQLAEQKARGMLDGWQAVSDAYPGPQQQQANQALVKRQLFDNGLLKQTLQQQLDIKAGAVATMARDMEKQFGNTLAAGDWAKAAGQPYSTLWLGCEKQCASIVRLTGIRDQAALQTLAGMATENSLFVDRVETINRILADYRRIASAFLMLALGLILLFLALYLGLRSALLIVLVPVTALLLSVATLSLAGFGISMFHVFGLLLALGISLDYAIFCRVGRHAVTTAMALVLSLVTSLLAFGLLATSSTAFIQAFGLSLASGIVFAFALAPLIAARTTEKEEL